VHGVFILFPSASLSARLVLAAVRSDHQLGPFLPFLSPLWPALPYLSSLGGGEGELPGLMVVFPRCCPANMRSGHPRLFAMGANLCPPRNTWGAAVVLVAHSQVCCGGFALHPGLAACRLARASLRVAVLRDSLFALRGVVGVKFCPRFSPASASFVDSVWIVFAVPLWLPPCWPRPPVPLPPRTPSGPLAASHPPPPPPPPPNPSRTCFHLGL
jgi:hypothetical protein